MKLGTNVMVLDPDSRLVKVGKLVGSNYNHTYINGEETECTIYTVEVNGNPRDLMTVDGEFVKSVGDIIIASGEKLLIRSVDYDNKRVIVKVRFDFLTHDVEFYIEDEDENVEVVDDNTITIKGNDDKCCCDDCDGCNDSESTEDLDYEDGYMDGFAEAYKLFVEWFDGGYDKTTLDELWDEIGGENSNNMSMSEFDPKEICAKFIEKISKEA